MLLSSTPARGRRAATLIFISATVLALGFPAAMPPPVAAVPGDPCDPADPECDPGPTNGTVTVTMSGPGASRGRVTSDPAGIDCGSTCTATFTDGQSVTLTAAVDAGWSLTGWSGCATASGLTCTVTAAEAGAAVSATFADVTAPGVTLTSPAGGGIHRGTILLTASAFDQGSGASRVEFYAGGFFAGQDWVAPYEVYWSSAGKNGPYGISAVAYDAAGNSAWSNSANVTIDNTAPTGSITTPSSDAIVDGAIDLSADASDLHTSVVAVYFQVVRPDGGLVWTPGRDQEAPWTIRFDPTALGVVDGAYRARAYIDDRAGNRFLTSDTPFRIDRAAPTLSIQSPAEDAVIEAGSTSLSATASDAGGTPTVGWAYAPLGSTSFTGIGSGTSREWDVSAIPEGRYTLRATATDLAGRQTVVTRSVTLDRAAPTADIGALPAYQTAPAFTVSWSGSDAGTGVASYEVRQQSAAYNAGTFGAWTTWQAATTGTSATFTGVPGTSHCFSVRSRDGVDNLSPWSASSCTSVPLDDRKMKPAPSGAWTRNNVTSAPDARYFGSTYSRSTRLGATLTRSGVQGLRVAIMATKCSTCGKVKVLWNGSVIRTVNLAQATTQRKVVIEVLSFGSLQFGTIGLKQATSGKLVEIDGIVVSKT